MSDSEGKLITFSACLFAIVISIVGQLFLGCLGLEEERFLFLPGRSRRGWGVRQ